MPSACRLYAVSGSSLILFGTSSWRDEYCGSIVGTSLIGLILFWFDMSKEAGIEVSRDNTVAQGQVIATIALPGNGPMTLDGQPLELSELAERVPERIAALQPGQYLAVNIVVDAETDNIHLVSVMDTLARAGATNVAISANPATQPDE